MTDSETMKKKKLEIHFDLELVKKFIHAVRTRGEDELNRVFSDQRYSEIQLSTPMLAWLFSHRQTLGQEKLFIEKLIDLDLKRQKSIVGHFIFEDQKIEKYPEHEEVYAKAIELIATAWPEFYALIMIVQPRLSFQVDDRQEFESQTDAKTFGDIVYKMNSDCPAMWAEIIVHEVAHLYLNVLLATTKIDERIKLNFRNSRFSYQRRSERPLIGILHGVFAQSNILHFSTRLFMQAENEAVKKGAQKTYRRFADVFLQDKETVLAEQMFFHEQLETFVQVASRSCQEMRL